MLDIRYSTRFKKDYKSLLKRGFNLQPLQEAVELLSDETPLPAQYKDHALTGNYTGHRECHIAPDWLLIYKLEQELLLLTLTRTGTHSGLF